VKDLLRTVSAAVIGAVVALAVVVGQPALAHQVDKAKAKKITSAQIKNGTIRTKDLSAEVAGPLAKAGTALQSIPAAGVSTTNLADGSVTGPKVAPNAVTGPKVADHSLTVADTSLFTGDASYDVPNLGPGGCSASAAIETGHATAGDLILVSQPAGVSGALMITGRSDSVVPTAINIVWCNVGTAAFNAPITNFTYAVFDN
jgi:hypothetical protein